MKNSSLGITANRVLESLTCINVYVICAAALNMITVLLLRSLELTLVCPECESAELRISHKQYILYTLPNMEVTPWGTTD
jgi:hypothetical protein